MPSSRSWTGFRPIRRCQGYDDESVSDAGEHLIVRAALALTTRNVLHAVTGNRGNWILGWLGQRKYAGHPDMTRTAGWAGDVFFGVLRPGVIGENKQLMVTEIEKDETAQASVSGA